MSSFKRPKRSKSYAKRHLEQRVAKANNEIDTIYAEFDEQLKLLEGNGNGGALYARESSRYQDSVPAQVRGMLQQALEKGIYIAREHIFFDIAIRGSKRHRNGLDQATAVVRDTDNKILVVFKTNRLYRKMYRALEYVDRLTATWEARVVFVRDNLDSAAPDYQAIKLQLLAMLDEHGRRAHVDNIQSKHLDMLARQLVHGTITFGYRGVEVEGQKTKRDRPRRKFAIDPNASVYVARIFTWYVEDRLSISEIVRRLNGDPNAPLPPRCEVEWTPLAVKYLLKNDRYIGVFKYGEKESIELPDADYVLRRDRKDPLGVIMVEPLRIISDELFFEAQELLHENKSQGGRRRGVATKPTGHEIIRGLFECPEHECPLWISGKSMYCKHCHRLPRESRYLHTQLKCSDRN